MRVTIQFGPTRWQAFLCRWFGHRPMIYGFCLRCGTVARSGVAPKPGLEDFDGGCSQCERSYLDIDPVLVDGAVAFLRRTIPPETRTLVRDYITADPQHWWVPYHFTTMMGVRNALRGAGFGEVELGIDNLDDYAVELVELAV